MCSPRVGEEQTLRIQPKMKHFHLHYGDDRARKLHGYRINAYVRLGSRLCENSEVQFAWRKSVLVSLILEISCTDRLGQEKEIENIFLLVLGSRTFSHSLGQTRTSDCTIAMSAFPPLAT